MSSPTPDEMRRLAEVTLVTVRGLMAFASDLLSEANKAEGLDPTTPPQPENIIKFPGAPK